MTETARSDAILRGWVAFRLNSRLKSYQYLWTVRWGNGYYNFAAGSFPQRNFVADFIRLKLN